MDIDGLGPSIIEQMIEKDLDVYKRQVMSLGEGTKIQILAPVIRGKKGEHKKVFENARKSGYAVSYTHLDVYKRQS